MMLLKVSSVSAHSWVHELVRVSVEERAAFGVEELVKPDYVMNLNQHNRDKQQSAS